MGREIDVLVLDHSGVISDDFSIIVNCVNITLASFGYNSVDRAFVSRSFAPSAEAFYRNAFPKLDVKECARRHFEALSVQQMPLPLPGAVDAVKSLFRAGIFLFICSSHPEQKLIAELADFGIADYFTTIKGSVDKSRTEGIKNLLALCRTKNYAYVGDTNIDYELAKKSRIPFYAIASEYQGHSFLQRFVKKERIFNSLKDLSDMLT